MYLKESGGKRDSKEVKETGRKEVKRRIEERMVRRLKR